MVSFFVIRVLLFFYFLSCSCSNTHGGTYLRTGSSQPSGPMRLLTMLDESSAMSLGGMRNVVVMSGDMSALMWRMTRSYS